MFGRRPDIIAYETGSATDNAGVNVPLPDLPKVPLFPSFDQMFGSLKSSFTKFLSTLRKSRVSAARGSRHRSSVSSKTTGRNIRTISYVRGLNDLAPVASILAGISNGKYDTRTRQLHLADSDLVGWNRLEYESLTLILLVDVSHSTWPFLKVFQSLLQSLTGNFRKHNDRVGLISLQGLQARIVITPTHNFRVVARALRQLEFHGQTPLADGLTKSLTMATMERNKNPGSKGIVVLLSDCYPEPLTTRSENLFNDPAYRSSIKAAAPYKRAGVMLLIINPDFNSEEAVMPGEILATRLADVSRGRLIKLIRRRYEKGKPPTSRELQSVMQGIEDMVIGDKKIT